MVLAMDWNVKPLAVTHATQNGVSFRFRPSGERHAPTKQPDRSAERREPVKLPLER